MSLYHTLSHIQRPVRHVSVWMEIGEGGRGRELRETEMRGREKKRGRGAWASPAFLEGGGGQDRAWGRHLTAAYTLSAFGRFNQWGGDAVHFSPIQPVWGGEREEEVERHE